MNQYQKFVAEWYSLGWKWQMVIMFLSFYVAFHFGRIVGGMIW